MLSTDSLTIRIVLRFKDTQSSRLSHHSWTVLPLQEITTMPTLALNTTCWSQMTLRSQACHRRVVEIRNRRPVITATNPVWHTRPQKLASLRELQPAANKSKWSNGTFTQNSRTQNCSRASMRDKILSRLQASTMKCCLRPQTIGHSHLGITNRQCNRIMIHTQRLITHAEISYPSRSTASQVHCSPWERDRPSRISQLHQNQFDLKPLEITG